MIQSDYKMYIDDEMRFMEFAPGKLDHVHHQHLCDHHQHLCDHHQHLDTNKPKSVDIPTPASAPFDPHSQLQNTIIIIISPATHPSCSFLNEIGTTACELC
eukprot:332486_1